MLIAARVMTGTLRTEVPTRIPRLRTAISGADEETANCKRIVSICTGSSHQSNERPKGFARHAKFDVILQKQSLTERSRENEPASS